MNRIVIACHDQMLHFDTKTEYEAFVAQLKRNNRIYKINEVQNFDDQSVNVRIKRQYGSTNFDEFLK